MSAYTPGPFEKGPELGGVTERTFPCAVCGGVSTMRGCSLHAAAPELLEALESMLNIEGAAINGGRLGAWKGLNVPYHFEKARAAIARAKGETNG